MPPTIIATPDAPAAIGTYSQAVRTGNLVFLSGQIPLDPATMEVVEGGTHTHTHTHTCMHFFNSDICQVV